MINYQTTVNVLTRHKMSAAMQRALHRSGLPARLTRSVLNRYQEPGRHYHSQAHLERMFDMAEQHDVPLSESQILAILFHDAVYDVNAPKGENEHFSAELLKDMCTIIIDKHTLNEACNIILCTVNHEGSTEVQRQVIDLDLAGLALSMPELEADSKNVYLEYQELISWQDYKVARAKFFSKLLGRPSILTSCALSGLEVALRSNLHQVIESSKQETNTFGHINKNTI